MNPNSSPGVNYTDENGQIIPHLLMTNTNLWPPSLVEYIDQEIHLTPDECVALPVNDDTRFGFDQAVRRWVSSGNLDEARTFMSLDSGLQAIMPGGTDSD
jgi:hypothetical protein